MILKPGYKTTEFVASLLASIGAWLAEWQGSLQPKWAAIVTSASFAAYAFSRAITKHGVATSGKPVVTVAPAAPAAPVVVPAQSPVQQV
jgi:EamA domain-containing membrane protein RarD